MKRWLPTILLAAAVLGMLVHGPIPQLANYHRFADTRSFFGIANAADVLSNAAFALVALWGYRVVNRHPPSSARPAYYVFVLSLALTALGSAYYHLAPDNARLVYDRIPIALACAGLLAGVHAETHAATPRALLPGLAALAIASVFWWSFTEARGMGDLRPYLLIQLSPLALIPLWQWLAGSPREERIGYAAAIALYALAKVTELADGAIFDALGFVSGHTLKHLLAAGGAAMIAYTLARRA